MFSDESTFRCVRSIKTHVRRPEGSNRFDSWFTVKMVKHPDSVMVWGCFSGVVGHGGLYFLPKNVTINAERYEDVLENHLLQFMAIHGATNFLQDGAPCHASKRIKAYVANKPFEVVDWPGNSPDLNHIENCWNFMQSQLRNRDISSVPKLKEEIMKIWLQELSLEYFKSLTDFMPARMQQVIQAKRDMTKY
jgi:hypothetical protein